MSTLPQFTEEHLKAIVPDQTLARGRALYISGAVPGRYQLEGDELEAEVREGNRFYNPHIYFDGPSLIGGCECRVQAHGIN
jgi:hypothetical protein